MEDKLNDGWLKEKIQKMPNNNGTYKLSCLMLAKRKMTYQEMFLLIYALNEKKYKKDEIYKLKEEILKELLEIYKFNNGHYPKIEK